MSRHWHWISVLSIFLLVNIAFSETHDYPAKVELKSGRTIKVHITEIDYWGMWLRSNQGLSFKVVKTLSTTSQTLIKEIQSYVQDLKVNEQNNITQINFTEASFPPVLDKHPGVFRSHSYTLGGLTSRGENLVIELTRIPRFTDWMVMRFGFSQGWYRGDFRYSISRISLGLGLRYPMVNQDILLLANISYVQNWLTHLESDGYEGNYPAGTHEQVSYYLSTDYRRYLAKSPFYVSLGARVYLRNLPVNHRTTWASATLGIGYTFRY